MKTVITSFCLLVFATLFSQDYKGQAFYEYKIQVEVIGDRNMTGSMRKQIEENVKKNYNKTYVLTFNKDESLYEEQQKLDMPGTAGITVLAPTEGAQYKNTRDNLFLQEQDFFGKQFLINDTLPKKIDWKLENESKQIGQYVVFKATAVKKLNAGMQSIHQHSKDEKAAAVSKDSVKSIFDEIEVPVETIITAWYTPQIPVSQGPGEYWGLPGLILEVQAYKTSILCSKIVMNAEEAETIKKPTKGTKVTQEEYEKIVKEKTEEMQEMYSGQRRRGDGMQIRMN